MTATEPTVKPLGRYNATEASRLLDIHRNSLGNYTRAGLIAALPRLPGSKETLYMGREITRLWKQKRGNPRI